MSSGMSGEVAGLNEDRFVYVQALLIGRSVRVRTAGAAVYEGLFHSCSQDQSSSIVLQDAREQKNGQNTGEVIPTLIIAGDKVESLQAYNVPMECELFGAPGSERLHISEPVPGSHASHAGHAGHAGATEPQEVTVSEYTQDSVTTMDPNLIPKRQREEAERLGREIEAGRHPASGGGALEMPMPQAVAELPRPDFGRPGRSDLLRVKTARKDGIWRQPTAGRGLNAMNLELPMRGVNHETRSQPDVDTNNENQVTERALHQLKELQNVQGPAATRQVLLRQHYRYEGTPPPEEGAKRHSMKGLRPLGLLEPVPRGREEPIMAGPVVPGLATGSNLAGQAGWGKNVDMVALTKSINSLNLEPGPPKQQQNEALQLLHLPDEEPIGAERSDTPESQMMPVFHPKAPEEQMEMLQEQQQQLQQQMQQQQQQQQQLQQQMQQQQQLQQQQLLQMQQLSPQQLQQLQMQLQQQMPLQNQPPCNNQMQNDQPLQRMLLNASATASYMAQTEVDRRKAAGSLEGRKDGTPSTPSSLGQPLQPGQQPSRPEEGKQRRASKELATPVSLSEELPQLLKVGRQRGGKGAANERRDFFHRANTPSNDEGEPAGLPLQTRVEHRSEVPVDQEQGPLEPGLMKREEEKMPQFQCGAGSPLTTGMVITRFFDQASKEQAVNSPVQWPQAIGGSYKNILTEQLQFSSPSQTGMGKAPQVPDLPQVPMQHEVQQAPASQVQSQQMPMRQSGGGAAHQQQAMNRPSPMLPGPMSNDSAVNWQSPGTPAGTQSMARSPQGGGGEVDNQGQKGGKREKRGRKTQKERASRPENTAGASGPGHAPSAPSAPSVPSVPSVPSGPAGPGPGGCAAGGCATAAAPGNCGGCGNCGMPCQPCGCAMMGGCCGGCCVLGCGGGGDGSCGLGSNAPNRSNPAGGCGCGACGQLAAAGGQLGGCAACSGPGPCGPCGCSGCNQMGQMSNAMACGGCGGCGACGSCGSGCCSGCGSCGGGNCGGNCGPSGCGGSCGPSGCGACCSSCTGACGACNSGCPGNSCGGCGACGNSCGGNCQGCGGSCQGCGNCAGCGGCNPCGCMPCGGAGCLPCAQTPGCAAGCNAGCNAGCAAGGCMPCNCGAAAGCDGGTPCNSMDSANFRGSGCGGCCQAAMCGGTPCGCSSLPSGGCCSPAGSGQAAQPGGDSSGNCGGCNFNSQQLPLVGLLPIQQGMPLGMPMALISTGGGQGGCFPAAYLMAQDSMQQQQQPTPNQMNPQMPQMSQMNHQ